LSTSPSLSALVKIKRQASNKPKRNASSDTNKKGKYRSKNQDTTTAKNASKANVAKQKRKKLFPTHRYRHANVQQQQL